MNYSVVLNVIGLTLNVFGSILLIIPSLRSARHVDDDYIVSMDKQSGIYTQKKHIAERRLALVGFILFGLGFIVQILGVLT